MNLLLLLKKPRLDHWYRQRCSFININTVPTVFSSTVASTSRTESASIQLPSTSFSYVRLCTGLAPFWARLKLYRERLPLQAKKTDQLSRYK